MSDEKRAKNIETDFNKHFEAAVAEQKNISEVIVRKGTPEEKQLNTNATKLKTFLSSTLPSEFEDSALITLLSKKINDPSVENNPVKIHSAIQAFLTTAKENDKDITSRASQTLKNFSSSSLNLANTTNTAHEQQTETAAFNKAFAENMASIREFKLDHNTVEKNTQEETLDSNLASIGSALFHSDTGLSRLPPEYSHLTNLLTKKISEPEIANNPAKIYCATKAFLATAQQKDTQFKTKHPGLSDLPQTFLKSAATNENEKQTIRFINSFDKNMEDIIAIKLDKVTLNPKQLQTDVTKLEKQLSELKSTEHAHLANILSEKIKEPDVKNNPAKIHCAIESFLEITGRNESTAKIDASSQSFLNLAITQQAVKTGNVSTIKDDIKSESKTQDKPTQQSSWATGAGKTQAQEATPKANPITPSPFSEK